MNYPGILKKVSTGTVPCVGGGKDLLLHHICRLTVLETDILAFARDLVISRSNISDVSHRFSLKS